MDLLTKMLQTRWRRAKFNAIFVGRGVLSELFTYIALTLNAHSSLLTRCSLVIIRMELENFG